MRLYLLKGANVPDELFCSKSDEEAEEYIEEMYVPEDGRMILYKLTSLVEWP